VKKILVEKSIRINLANKENKNNIGDDSVYLGTSWFNDVAQGYEDRCK
jgi:hypothetical protein